MTHPPYSAVLGDEALIDLAVAYSLHVESEDLGQLVVSIHHVAGGCSLNLECPYIERAGMAALAVTLAPSCGHRLAELLSALVPPSEENR